MQYQLWPEAGPHYGDSLACPYCRNRLTGPECTACDLPLDGDDMQQAYYAGVSADQWLAVREHHLKAHHQAVAARRQAAAVSAVESAQGSHPTHDSASSCDSIHGVAAGTDDLVSQSKVGDVDPTHSPSVTGLASNAPGAVHHHKVHATAAHTSHTDGDDGTSAAASSSAAGAPGNTQGVAANAATTASNKDSRAGLNQTNALAGAGAVLLALAVLVFLATSWTALGVVGQFTSLLGVAALFGTLTMRCSRKNLRTTAEASAVIAAGSAFASAFAFDQSNDWLLALWMCLVTGTILGLNTYTDLGRKLASLSVIGALAVVPATLTLTHQIISATTSSATPERLHGTGYCVVFATSLWLVAQGLSSNIRLQRIERWLTPLNWALAVFIQNAILIGNQNLAVGIVAFTIPAIGAALVLVRNDLRVAVRHVVAMLTVLSALWGIWILSYQNAISWNAVTWGIAGVLVAGGIWRRKAGQSRSTFWHVPTLVALAVITLTYSEDLAQQGMYLIETAIIREPLKLRTEPYAWSTVSAVVALACAACVYCGSRVRHVALTVATLAIVGLWRTNSATALWLVATAVILVVVTTRIKTCSRADLIWSSTAGTLGVCIAWSFGPWVGAAFSLAALALVIVTVKSMLWQNVATLAAALTASAFLGLGTHLQLTLSQLIAAAVGSCCYAALWSWRHRDSTLQSIHGVAVSVVVLLLGPGTLLYSLRSTWPEAIDWSLHSSAPSALNYAAHALVAAAALWILWQLSRQAGLNRQATETSWCHHKVVSKIATAVLGTAIISLALRFYHETVASVVTTNLDIPALMHAAAPLALIGVGSRWKILEYRTCFMHGAIAVLLTAVSGQAGLASLWLVCLILAAAAALNTSAHTWNKPPRKRLASYRTTVVLLAASLISHMAYQGVNSVEWYTWPLALVIAGAGWFWCWRHPDEQSRQQRSGSYWAAALLATWPTALMSTAGDWRGWFVLGGAAVVGMWLTQGQLRRSFTADATMADDRSSSDSADSAKSDSIDLPANSGQPPAPKSSQNQNSLKDVVAKGRGAVKLPQSLPSTIAAFVLATLMIGPGWQALVVASPGAVETIAWWATVAALALVAPSPWRSTVASLYVATAGVLCGYGAATAQVVGAPAELVIHAMWLLMVIGQLLTPVFGRLSKHAMWRFNLQVGVWMILAWSQVGALGWKPEVTSLWYSVIACAGCAWWLIKEHNVRSWPIALLPLLGVVGPLLSALHRSPSGDAALYAMAAVVAAVAVILLVGGWELGWKAPAVTGMTIVGYLALYIVANTEQQISTTLITLVVLGLALLWFGARSEAHLSRIKPLHERFNQLR